jgi:hypothetical protein
VTKYDRFMCFAFVFAVVLGAFVIGIRVGKHGADRWYHTYYACHGYDMVRP